MINVSDNIFVLNTKDTTYVFGILPTGQPEHIYYGRKITVADASGLREKHVFQPVVSQVNAIGALWGKTVWTKEIGRAHV